jgi:hypothetical protein
MSVHAIQPADTNLWYRAALTFLQIYFQIMVTLKQQQKWEIPRSPYWINYF